jgi:uncharacterized protein YndB with AHSA1/START domain
MAVNHRLMKGVSSEDVWAALTDGECYEHWVVGTRKIRAVDAGWPRPPAELHYTVGYFPLRKDSTTRALEFDPGTRLVLRAHAWPAGTARIELVVEQTPEGALVTIDEAPDAGPAKLLHNPLADAALKLRNVETLRRLEQQARRHAPARG